MAVIVGSGDYRYEQVRSWPSMPRYWSFEIASDVGVNSNDEVHVLCRGKHTVTIWDTDGSFITSWGEGLFSPNPHAIYIAPNDNIWIVDTNFHIATEHEPDGTLIRTLGRKLWPSNTFAGIPFNMPSGLAIAPNGDLFVSDGYGGHRVQKFSPEGDLLQSWGRQGDSPGQFALLHNVEVDKNSRVYICDRENDRIQVFDDQGGFIKEWTDFQMPGDLWIVDDIMYVGEQGGGGAVGIWTLEGELITRWRGSEGPTKGLMEGAHGICVDSQGSIYVAELSGRVQKFQRI